MTALRREAAAAKDERVQAEEAHRVTRRRLEEAETARGPQDDVKALLAAERIQRLEADLALKTRASEEAVAQASLREQGATVHAHAAKAALAEAGARLQRFATRVQELVDLEVASGKGQSSPEGRTELREVVWAFDDGALRAEEGPLTTALERARSRALAEAAKACDAVAAPSVKALTELVCRTLPARRRNVKSDRVPELERALAAAKERYAQHATDMADAQAQLAELKEGLTQLHAQNSTLSEQLDEKTRVADAARREAVDLSLIHI